MTKRCGKHSNKWLSSEAIAARRTRRLLERRYRRTRSKPVRLAFHAAPDVPIMHHAIKASRRDFYAAKLADVDGDARGRWKLTRELLHTDERTAGKGAAESQLVCDGFRNFFSDKLSKIATRIHDIVASGTLPPSTTCLSSVLAHFVSISVEEVVLAIRGIPTKTSPLDFMLTPLLKSCADVFGPLLANLVNTSFCEGIFPDLFKVGQVTPIQKVWC